nr:hypothetical protein B0A51_16860 [Rachicladosporium sp. CCFEE 5018]
MVSYVTDYIQNTAAGYLKTGITAAGTMAGNTVGSVGGLVENTGRSVGQAIVGSIGGVGGYINNYGDGIRGKFAADGPVGGGAAKKVAVKPGAPAVKGAVPPGAKKPPATPVRTGVTPKPPVGGVRAPSKGTTAARAPNGKAMPSAASRPAGGVKPAVGGVARPAAPRPAVGAAKPPGGKTARHQSTMREDRAAQGEIKNQGTGDQVIVKQETIVRGHRAVTASERVPIKYEVIHDPVTVKREPVERESRAATVEPVRIKQEVIDDSVFVQREATIEFTSVKPETAEDVARAGGVRSAEGATIAREEVTGDLGRAGVTKNEWVEASATLARPSPYASSRELRGPADTLAVPMAGARDDETQESTTMSVLDMMMDLSRNVRSEAHLQFLVRSVQHGDDMQRWEVLCASGAR